MTATQKPSTVNTAGLQFVSAPVTTAVPAANITMNVIHGGRKTNPIIETFKCEVCNQVKNEITNFISSLGSEYSQSQVKHF